MPKQCPQCLQVYGDHAKFCDRDGAILDAASPEADPLATRIGSRRHRARRRLPWIIIAAALLAVVAVAAPGYLWLRGNLQSRVAVSLEGITLTGGASPAQGDERPSLLGRIVDLAKVAAGSRDLAARVKIANSTIFSGAIKSATYTIMAGDGEIGRGSWDSSALPLKFKAGEEFNLDLPFRLDGGNVAASALDALSGQPTPVEMRGEMGVEVFAITFIIPFRARLVTPRSYQ